MAARIVPLGVVEQDRVSKAHLSPVTASKPSYLPIQAETSIPQTPVQCDSPSRERIVTRLSFRDQVLDIADVQALAERKCSTFHVNLTNCSFATGALKVLVGAFNPKSHQLESLDLDGVVLTFSELKLMLSACSSATVEIAITRSELSSEGIKIVCDVIRKKARNVVKLVLDGNSLSDYWIHHLEPTIRGGLRELFLCKSQLTDLGMERLGNAIHGSGLESLYLEENPISYEGLRTFVKKVASPNAKSLLRILSLSGCPISDQGVEALTESSICFSVIVLNLCRCSLTDVAARNLASSMADLRWQVCILRLKDNKFTKGGSSLLTRAVAQRDVHMRKLEID